MITPSAERKTSYPYPIYLSGMHVEQNRALAKRQHEDYSSGSAFNLALSDISWMVDLEATYEKMQKDIPSYPAAYYKIHLAERIAFAVCVEHPGVDECLHLLVRQQCDSKMLLEVAAIARRMQRREQPRGHRWIQPAEAKGKLRDVKQFLKLGVVSEVDMVERALEHPMALEVVQEMLEAVEPDTALRMRRQLVRTLLAADEGDAQRLRAMLGLQGSMGMWEASRRFTLMFEYAAHGLLDEHQLLPNTLSAHPDTGIALQIRMLAEDRSYLNDMAQKDLPRVIERILQEAIRYPHITNIGQPPLHQSLIAQVIDFCVEHVRDGRNLIMHALLPNQSMGQMYCPAPWEPTAESQLATLLACIESGLSAEGQHMRVLYQIGRLLIPSEIEA